MNRQARSTAEKIVEDAQSGYENLQARLHDINKEILSGKTIYPSSSTVGVATASGSPYYASSNIPRYGTAEQQLLEEDAQRGEQLAREKSKLSVPSLTESLYPEEKPRTHTSEPLEPVKDFNTDEPRGSIDKFATASNDYVL